MDLEQQAEIARLITGSTMSSNNIIKEVMNVSKEIKKTVCPQVHVMIKHYDMPFDKAFPKVRVGFNQICSEFDLDPAVLFWIYMDWLKANTH